jgi:tetratricopeptide (TPR) repeat protein
MTTNNDFLLEHALLQSGVPKKNVIPVITRDDFERYTDPKSLFMNGKMVLYKLHGSTMNIITGEKTRDTLIITIRDLGSNKESINKFQLEPFKQLSFSNLTANRSLVVIGYSGSDFFDIIPMLKAQRDIKDIIWVNYVHNVVGELIYEIELETRQEDIYLNYVDEILVDIKKLNARCKIYRVDVNYTEMVRKLVTSNIKIQPDNFSFNIYEWLSHHLEIKPPSLFMKFYIAYKIYDDFDLYHYALNCSEKILQKARELKNELWEAVALNNIGKIYTGLGNYSEALNQCEKALFINERLENFRGKANNLNNIGDIFKAQGIYTEAMKIYNKALSIYQHLEEHSDMIKNERDHVSDAIRVYENPSERATTFNNIGLIYYGFGEYKEAFEHFKKSNEILEQIGDLNGIAKSLANMGVFYDRLGNINMTLKNLEESHNIHLMLNNLEMVAICLNQIGNAYYKRGNYPEAMKHHEEALKIFENIENHKEKASTIGNIGKIYGVMKNYPEAMKRYEEALNIAEQLGDLKNKADQLNNIFSLYINFKEAVK